MQQKNARPNETIKASHMMRPVDEDFEPVRPTMENNNTPYQASNGT